MTTLLTIKPWWIKGLALLALALALFVVALVVPRSVVPVSAQGTHQGTLPQPAAPCQAGSSPLTEFRRLPQFHGNYVAAGVGLSNSPTGNITVTLPPGAVVVEAYLYLGMQSYYPGAPTTTVGTLNTTTFNANLLRATRFSGSCYSTFRADVTGFVVPGTNTVVWNPPNFPHPAFRPRREGASLVVVYFDPNSPFNDIVINDGTDVVGCRIFQPPADTMSTVMTFSPATNLPSGPISAKTTTVVGNGQPGLPETQTITSLPSGGILPIQDPLNGSDGPLWDTDTYNISPPVVAPLDNSVRVTISSPWGFGDCLAWVAQVISVIND
jgi:hypothetical protein